jgi:Na+/H+-translocating membrane pyrophosphatase
MPLVTQPAATGKGFAIASAALTALALFAAFVGVAGFQELIYIRQMYLPVCL